MARARPALTFETRLTQRIEDIARRISPERRAKLRWSDRMHLVRAIVSQRLRREEAEEVGDLATLRLLDHRPSLNAAPPHPALLDLVRLLARQAAQADVAAQRAPLDDGDPA